MGKFAPQNLKQMDENRTNLFQIEITGHVTNIE
jgi:hypothetical protein